jgi:hypothetical protein
MKHHSGEFGGGDLQGEDSERRFGLIVLFLVEEDLKSMVVCGGEEVAWPAAAVCVLAAVVVGPALLVLGLVAVAAAAAVAIAALYY